MGLTLGDYSLIVCTEDGAQQMVDRPRGGAGDVCERQRRACLRGSGERKQMCCVIKALQRESGSSSPLVAAGSWERGHVGVTAVRRGKEDDSYSLHEALLLQTGFAQQGGLLRQLNLRKDRRKLVSLGPGGCHCSLQSGGGQRGST